MSMENINAIELKAVVERAVRATVEHLASFCLDNEEEREAVIDITTCEVVSHICTGAPSASFLIANAMARGEVGPGADRG